MNALRRLSACAAAFVFLGAFAHASDDHGDPVAATPYFPGKTLTQSVQAGFTPDSALAVLKAGNARFVSGKTLRRHHKSAIGKTALGQYPYASVLGCIDSRAAPELVFDQGIGDLFTARVAGNVVNEDILGSLEYASKAAGSRLVVVLGHTGCGAVKGACDGAQMGNLTMLLDKIKPSVNAASTPGEHNSKNHAFVDEVTELNVKDVIKNIREKSAILKELEDQGKIKIVGALYDTSNGRVLWY
ncbi:MAG: carbonic anhydrase [Betaproteobacteria bacterium]|nr:carbonic anhydrase [Betaproteobacteria bacterium]